MNEKRSVINSHGNRRGGRGWLRIAGRSHTTSPIRPTAPTSIRPPPRLYRPDPSPERKPRPKWQPRTPSNTQRPVSTSPSRRKPAVLSNRPRNAPWNRVSQPTTLTKTDRAVPDRPKMVWNIKERKEPPADSVVVTSRPSPRRTAESAMNGRDSVVKKPGTESTGKSMKKKKKKSKKQSYFERMYPLYILVADPLW